jgi:hypothetical protein
MKTKMRVYTLLLALLSSSGSIFAQSSADAGIVAGASTSSVKITNMNSTTLSNAASTHNITGVEGGIYGRLWLGSLYIKPMLLVSYQTGQLDFNYTDGSTKPGSFNDGKVEVPALLGLKVFGPLHIEAGPVYNWIFMASSDANSALHLEQSGLGYRLGANVGLGRLNIGLAYQGLANNSASLSNATFRMPTELILDLSVRLGKNKE